jgi:hypothetical protein
MLSTTPRLVEMMGGAPDFCSVKAFGANGWVTLSSVSSGTMELLRFLMEGAVFAFLTLLGFLELVALNPDIRSDAGIRSRFQLNLTSATAGGYPPA